MKGRGNLSHHPFRRFKWLMIVHVMWTLLVTVLGVWWGSLILSKSARIHELELQLNPQTQSRDLERTRRMIRWEATAFVAMILAGTGLLAWLYRRDMRRARSMQAFFASVTHELRTPLTSIRLQAESIGDALGSRTNGITDEENQLITRLLEDTTRLQSQVERTLELARVEGGGPVLVQPVQIRPSLERIRKNWNESNPDKLKIDLAATADLTVLADPSAVQVILKNLFENSIRHGKRSPVEVHLETVEHGKAIALKIRDNGEGFQGDARALGKLFEKGAQSQGAGVGLYLVSMLMQKMGGWAEFRASSGSGFETTLWFKGETA